MKERKFLPGMLCTIMAGVLWAANGGLCQHLFKHYDISTEWLIAVKMLVAGTVMLICDAVKNKRDFLSVPLDRELRKDFIIFILCGCFGMQYTYILGIQLSNAATATALQYTSTVMVMLWTAFRSKRVPTPVEIICVLLTVFGTFLISTHGDPTSFVISPLSLIVCLSSAVMLSIYTLQPARLLQKHSAFSLIGWSMLICGVISSLIFRIWTSSPKLDATAVLLILAISVMGTVVPFTIYLVGVSIVGGTRASVFANIEPVVAAVIVFGFMGTPFGIADIAGIALILSAVIMLSVMALKKSCRQQCPAEADSPRT